MYIYTYEALLANGLRYKPGYGMTLGEILYLSETATIFLEFHIFRNGRPLLYLDKRNPDPTKHRWSALGDDPWEVSDTLEEILEGDEQGVSTAPADGKARISGR